MLRAEENVEFAAKFYEARTAARSLLGSEYAHRIEQWTRLIRVVMHNDRKTALSACIALLKDDNNPFAQILLMAAAVEVIEQDLLTPERLA